MSIENNEVQNGISQNKQILNPETQEKIELFFVAIQNIISNNGEFEDQEKKEKVINLLSQLEIEIMRISNNVGYNYMFKFGDYVSDNYDKRLAQSDELCEKIFQEKVLSNIGLKKIYDDILKLCPEKLLPLIKKRLYTDYFEDLVYEIIGEEELLGYEESDLMEASDFDEALKMIQGLPKGTKVCNLECDIELNSDELIKIVQALPIGIKSLTFKFIDLGGLGGEKLIKVFQALPIGIKKIDLRLTFLGELTGDELVKVVQSLPKELRSLDLHGNSWELTGDELVKVMQSLPKELRRLDLGDISISLKELTQITQHLPKKLRSLELGNLVNYQKNDISHFTQSLPKGIKLLGLDSCFCEEDYHIIESQLPNTEIFFGII